MAHEQCERITGTRESRVAAEVEGELFKVPEGILLRVGSVETIFRDMNHLRLHLGEAVTRAREGAEQEQPPANEVPDARLLPDETAGKETVPKQERDWSLIMIQLAGAATALYLTGASDKDWPYLGFARLVVCGLSAYVAYVAGALRLTKWAWAMGALAVAFNPLFPAHLKLKDWVALDLTAGVGFVASIFGITTRGEQRNLVFTMIVAALIVLALYTVVTLIERAANLPGGYTNSPSFSY
jgi:hypothetical protein